MESIQDKDKIVNNIHVSKTYDLNIMQSIQDKEKIANNIIFPKQWIQYVL